MKNRLTLACCSLLSSVSFITFADPIPPPTTSPFQTVTVQTEPVTATNKTPNQAPSVQTQALTNVTYVHTDVLGSVVAESNASGTVTKTTDYKPFGESVDN